MLVKSTLLAAFAYVFASLSFASALDGEQNALMLDADRGSWFAYKPRDIDQQRLQSEYETWKKKHLVSCEDGSADVRKEGGEGVSEGTGYGMLLAVSLDDRETFARLLRAFEKRKNARGMMSWRFSLCGGSWGDGAATDGDLDIAMALVMAEHKWGSFRAAAEALISAIKQHASSPCNGFLVLRPGDNWGGCLDPGDQRLNPSYFAPAYYRAFGSFIPAQADFWGALAYDSYRLLDRYQSAMGGLFPDWAYAHGGISGPYGYEACRVPWRISMDWAWYGREEAKRVLTRMHDYAAARGGPVAASEHKNSCFIGGLALTANAISQERSDEWFGLWMSGIPEAPDPMVGDGPYYQGTLRVLYQALAGTYLKP